MNIVKIKLRIQIRRRRSGVYNLFATQSNPFKYRNYHSLKQNIRFQSGVNLFTDTDKVTKEVKTLSYSN